MHYFIFITFI